MNGTALIYPAMAAFLFAGILQAQTPTTLALNITQRTAQAITPEDILSIREQASLDTARSRRRTR